MDATRLPAAFSPVLLVSVPTEADAAAVVLQDEVVSCDQCVIAVQLEAMTPAKIIATVAMLRDPISSVVMSSGTGGVAFGKVSMDTTVDVGSFGSLKGSTDDTKTGWTAGGGAELAVANNFTLKAEALYFDLGDVSYSAGNPMTPSSVNTHKDINGVVVRGGVGYHF